MSTQPPDPETVLRLAGEEALAQCGAQARNDAGAVVAEVGSALVVLAGLDEEVARSIVDDYSLALAIRTDANRLRHRQFRRRHQRSQQHVPVSTTPPRIATVNKQVETSHGTMRVLSVLLYPHQVDLAVSYDEFPTFFQPRRSVAMPTLVVLDDQGNQAQGQFSGGGGREGAQGTWQCHGGLSSDTAWLEIEGTRVSLEAAAALAVVRVEPIESVSLVEHYLWQSLGRGHYVHFDLTVAQQAMELIGLGPDDPEFGPAYDYVADNLQDRTPATKPPRGVPREWRSFLARRGFANGPDLQLPFLAQTPEFEGRRAIVFDLRSSAEEFSLGAVVYGGVDARTTPWDDEIRTGLMTWWAEDDRGNSYRGHWSGHSSGGGNIQGNLQFGPALDPKATQLRLLLTGLRERAVITVDLKP